MSEYYKLVRVQAPASFLDKNKRLISFIGALIVFFTFIVKEGRVEQLKEQVASIDSAEKTFAVESDDSRTDEQLNALRKTVEERLVPYVYAGYGSDVGRDTAAITLADQTVLDAIVRVRTSTANLDEFLKLIPHPKELDDRLGVVNHDLKVYEHAEDRVKAEWTNQLKATHQVQDANSSGGVSDDMLHGEALSVELDLDAQLRGLKNYEEVANELRKKALESSRQYKELLEARQRKYQVIAIIAFSLGWGLGLVERLKSGEQSSEDEQLGE